VASVIPWEFSDDSKPAIQMGRGTQINNTTRVGRLGICSEVA